MKAKVQKWGNSLGIRIPRTLAREVSLETDSEVELPAGMKVEGVVLCDQLKSLDWKARHARRIGSLPGRSIKEIQARILALVQ